MSWTVIFAALLISATRAANLPSPLLIGYWGQDLARSQYWEATKQEPSLSTLCSTRHYNVYHIKGILSYSAVNNLPGLDLSIHCQFPANAFSGWPKTSANGFSLISCPSVGKDVATCQKLGKKIMLSIDPTDFMSMDPNSPKNPLQVAQNIWDLFLGGTSQYRPFGASVVDGIDLHIWNNNNIGVNLLATTLRNLMGDQYLLTITTRCQFPDYVFNPTTFPNPEIFDYYTPYFIQSPNVCGYSGNNPSGFWTTLASWSAWTSSITPQYESNVQSNTIGTTTNIGIPMAVGLVAWPTEAWAQAASGDYVPAPDYISTNFLPRLIETTSSSLVGISLQDVSYDALGRPCAGNDNKAGIALGTALGGARTYSDVVWGQLLGRANGTWGNASAAAQVCLAAGNVGTTSSSSSSSQRTATTFVNKGSTTWVTQESISSSARAISSADYVPVGSGAGAGAGRDTVLLGLRRVFCHVVLLMLSWQMIDWLDDVII